MRILYLAPFSPVPADFGGALRAFHLLRHLAGRQTVEAVVYGTLSQADLLRSALPSLEAVHSVEPTWWSRYRRIGQLLAAFSRRSFHHLAVAGPGMQAMLDGLLARRSFDLVHTEFSHLGPFHVRAPVLKVLDAHNVEHEVFRRNFEMLPPGLRKAHYWLEWKKQRRDELDCARAHDVILATSERDAEFFRSELRGVPCHVVPNGVDMDHFSPSAEEASPLSLVFTGMMAYVPNQRGILWFLDAVFPRVLEAFPGTTLHVVGKDPPADVRRRASCRVVVTGTVADVRPFVQRASVYVVPLRSGSGTRLKIMEALAMRKPVVTTRIGGEGIDLEHGVSALIADDAEAFADAVIRLLRDGALRTRLAAAGHRLVRERYRWSTIGADLDSLYQRLVAERSAHNVLY